MKKYKKAADRREQILKAACTIAEETHYRKIRRHHLAESCCTATGNISRIMGSMPSLVDSLIEYAIANNKNAVIAQAIIEKHPLADGLDTNLRREILSQFA